MFQINISLYICTNTNASLCLIFLFHYTEKNNSSLVGKLEEQVHGFWDSPIL